MSRSDIPTDAELATLRANWPDEGAVGETIHWLAKAVTLLKKEHGYDDRHTIPTPPPDHMDPDGTLMGVAPPSALVVLQHRCAACLEDFLHKKGKLQCPSCNSEDVFPTDDAAWPCGSCGKNKDGIDPCTCEPGNDTEPTDEE